MSRQARQEPTGRPGAVFLDRDGTLIEDVDFLRETAQIRLLPGAVEGLRLLSDAGWRLVIASNQSGVARGYFTEEELLAKQGEVEKRFLARGVRFEGFYYCPHLPDGVVKGYARTCDCRKPAPGLWHRAASELKLELTASVTIGDSLRDLEAGRAAGTRTVLVRTGKGESALRELAGEGLADVVVADLEKAARWILAV